MEKLLNKFKIAFTKGDTYALAVKIKNITDDLNSAYFTVKENPEDEPLIQKSLGSGIEKKDDRAYKNEKTYKIQLQSEDTANLEPLVQYLYDFRVAIGNVVKTLISGVFVVNHSISEVSTTITSTLEVAIEDTVESELSTTAPTSGIEYEQDPVACAKIGDLTKLNTTAKETIVKAINEAVAKNTATQGQVTKILNGTTPVPKATNATNAVNAENATNADSATYAQSADNATNTDYTDFTNAEWSAKTESATLTEAGTYQVLAELTFTGNNGDYLHKWYGEIYFDGTNETDGTSSTGHSFNTETNILYMRTLTPTISKGTNGEMLLHAEYLSYAIGANLVDAITNYTVFKYRKIR